MATKMTGLMRAVRYHKFGGPNVLQIDQIQKPSPSKNQVLIKIKSAGINPVDTYFRDGVRNPNLPLPHIPGKDGAGIVEDVGTDVKDFNIGQRVLFCALKTEPSNGASADYIAVDESEIWPLNDKLSFSQGAAVGTAYLTAYRAIITKGEAKKGDVILIHGASGSVGLAAVQISRHLGLNVLATAGTPQGMQLVTQNGADSVFCHRDDHYLDAIKEATKDNKINLIVEMLTNVNLGNDLPLLAKNGKVLIVGSRGTVTINPRDTMGPELSIIGIMLYNNTVEESAQMKQYFIKGIDQGWVKPIVAKEYPMSEAAQAHHDIIHSTAGSQGKLVIVME